MHYIIIIIVVACIVLYQFRVFKDTNNRLLIFRDLFPDNSNYAFRNDVLTAEIENASDMDIVRMLIESGIDEKKFCNQCVDDHGGIEYVLDVKKAKRALLKKNAATNEIYSPHQNPIFVEILKSINNYLVNNKGSVSDFHLMKDIVDRNCEAAEDEINTQIPVPLYLGLTGTMIGILVGVGYLWLSGDLDALLNASESASGASGVKALLGGVALAMISSIIGILLTTTGSMKAKSAKSKTEHNKHVFLSWVQANLLPSLNNDTAQVLEKMSHNLVMFNETFTENTSKLDNTLSQVNAATKLQKELLDAVSKIADKDVATQNIQVYKALKDCSGEIGTLVMYLQNTTEYLNAVRDLTEKLDKDDRRSQAIERMLAFFENETSQIEQRRMAMSKAVGEIDSQLEGHLRKLSEHTAANIEKFNLALGKQQDALQQKLSETQVLMDELKNLSSIKSSIAKFEKATDEQNRKIDALTNAIHKIVEAKTQQVESPTSNAAGSIVHRKKGKWLALSIPFVFLLLLFAAILIIANWNNVSDFIKMFEF